MLPYRTDVAIVPVFQYPPGQPPAVPSIVPPPLVAPYLAEITSMVINELGQKAYSNATRLFAYNALSENNWRNQRLDKLVEFICDTIANNLAEGKIASPQQGMQETVVQCVTMTVSSMIFEFPDLKTNLPPNILDAAIQNVQVLNDLQTKINVNKGRTMYPQQQVPQPVMQPAQQPVVFPDQFGRPCTYDQQGRIVLLQQPMPQPVMQPGYPQQAAGYPQQPMGYPQQPMGYPQFQQAPNQAAGRWAQPQPGTQSFGAPPVGGQPQPQQNQVYDRYSRNPAPVQPAQVPQAPAPQPVVELTEDDWRPSDEQYYRAAYDPTRFRAVYRRSPVGNVIEEIEKIMDREKHRTVLGGVKLPAHVEDLAVEEAVKAIEARANFKSQPVPTKEGLILTNFLDEAINDGNVDRLAKDKDTYRVVAQVCQPLVQTEDTADYLKSFSQCKDLTTLCQRLKATGMAVDNWQSMDAILDYLLRIDNFVTEVVNSFIHNELSLESLTIDSFSEDYLDLRRYLGKTYGDRYALALQTFDKEVMSGLFQAVDSEMKDTLESNVVGETVEDVYVSFIPHTVSITYTPVCGRELNVRGGAARLIQADAQPILFNLAESLFVGKTDTLESVEPVHHYLITRDGMRFKLHKGRLSSSHSSDCYLVSKA